MNVRRKALAAVAACALAVPVVAAADATAKPNYDNALVGRWDMTVTIHIQDPPLYAPLFCDFTADYQLHCKTKPDNPDQYEGRGVWTMAKDGQFSFWISHHAHRDANGNPVGSINASHLGRVSPNKNKFNTHGHTYINLDDGSPWQGPVNVEAAAFRI